MKTLTICQPYAELIISGTKLVENRPWQTAYRGPLLIHAGKSQKWMLDYPEVDLPSRMDFGAIVGVVEVVKCLSWSYIYGYNCDDRYRYLRDDPHAGGPFCFVLRNPLRFARPISYRGAQGLFNVPDSVVQEALANGRSE